ncbi:response regulator [Mesobacillus zeae]|uniref:Response regulator n=1 Tax=Mesobacillus zeae TaxID=1917180 RepID=A0A398BBS9_9BACI|nr:response regulator [Mesobacillus zeae]RID87505.1 response regulator [Mesobacillus zeae]
MNFFIVDDSTAIRAMLSDIIESEKLGTVVGEATDGVEVTYEQLHNKEIDFLLIDLLMPERDGIETIREINPQFTGRIIMISQIVPKDMVAEAYLLGINHFITKPINKYEFISVIKNETKHYLQEKSLLKIQQSLLSLTHHHYEVNKAKILEPTPDSHLSILINSGKNLLMELGIVGENGYYELLEIIEYLFHKENNTESRFQFPSLKELFEKIAGEHCKASNREKICIKKEAKASEQRVRRAIQHALNNLASLGLTDYANPIFESYASSFFDFTQVRMKMLELEGKETNLAPLRLNIKKFIEALYIEAKKSMIE